MFDESMFNQEEYEVCEFCGVNMDVWDEHRSECPVNFVSQENFEYIRKEQDAIYKEVLEGGDFANMLGTQMLIAIDLLISSQKKWQNKSLMSKFDELLNRYSDLTGFTKALHQSGVLNTADDVIKFLEDPSMYDELFSVWMEHGQPDATTDTWIFFQDSVSSKRWNQDNKHS